MFLTAAGIISIQSCHTPKAITKSTVLKFNFEKGQGYDYEMQMEMDQRMMSRESKMNISSYHTVDVVGEDDSSKTIVISYKSFKMKMDMMGMNIDVDSEKPAPPL